MASKRRLEKLKIAKSKGNHTASEWKAVRTFFGGMCVACDCIPEILTKDHIIPISRGGSNSINNLQPLCDPCHKKQFRHPDYRVTFCERHGLTLPIEWVLEFIPILEACAPRRQKRRAVKRHSERANDGTILRFADCCKKQSIARRGQFYDGWKYVCLSCGHAYWSKFRVDTPQTATKII